LRHDVNKGKGATVRTGLQAADGDLFIIQDADLELTPCDIPVMLRMLKNCNASFVNGSRYLAGIERPTSSKSRIFFNKLFTRITALLTRSTITDMACGYKLFTRELYEKLTLKENRFAFETELIIKALRVHPRGLVEVPVHYFPRNSRQGKKLRTSDGLVILRAIIRYGLLKKD
jgi:glycosyltransferase involved in cell wall biosynthesis